MGSTDKVLPGTVLFSASAAAKLPDNELLEVAEIEAAEEEAETEDAPCKSDKYR